MNDRPERVITNYPITLMDLIEILEGVSSDVLGAGPIWLSNSQERFYVRP